MSRRYVFVDEAGNFDFTSKGSAYFILTSVALDDCAIGDELLALRRELVWRGTALSHALHAAEDRQAVRDEVFTLINRHSFRIDCTIFDKSLVDPEHKQPEAFYRLAWYLHMKYVAPQLATADDELLVVGASLATRRKQELVAASISDVLRETTQCATLKSAYWPAATDPCLQIADYCCWAVQRKWERDDERSYRLIRDKLWTEHVPFGQS